jgi:hypothetical protein
MRIWKCLVSTLLMGRGEEFTPGQYPASVSVRTAEQRSDGATRPGENDELEQPTGRYDGERRIVSYTSL